MHFIKNIFVINRYQSNLIKVLTHFRLHCTKIDESLIYKEPNQVKSLFKFWENSFKKYEIPEPKESIEHILAFSLGSTKISDVYKNFETVLPLEKAQEINKLCFLRLKRMPIQYILREWDFRDLTLKMKPPVFIPRPETENLIDIIVNDFQKRSTINILEICCGSGAISLALLKAFKEAKVTAVDVGEEACQLTRENAALHNLDNKIKVIQSSVDENYLLDDITDTFDIIVSNPPYVPENDMKNLAPEIKNFEDLRALNGGVDGLKVIRNILKVASKKLKCDGCLYLEVDPSHPKIIEDYVQNNFEKTLKFIETYKDFCKKDRFVKICKVKS